MTDVFIFIIHKLSLYLKPGDIQGGQMLEVAVRSTYVLLFSMSPPNKICLLGLCLSSTCHSGFIEDRDKGVTGNWEREKR